jgi:hypothetical protein
MIGREKELDVRASDEGLTKRKTMRGVNNKCE